MATMCCSCAWLRYVGQVMFAFVVVFPLDVFFWRGTWDLLDYYVVVDCAGRPTNGSRLAHEHGMQHENYAADCAELTGNWISALFGMAVCVLMNCLSPSAHSAADRCRRSTFHVVSRMHSYAYAIAYLGQWRGVWNLVDAYSDDYRWKSNLVGFVICLTVNFLFRLNRLWASSPWVVEVDADKDHFVSKPWLRSSPEDGRWRYCIDQLLSQVICVSLTISTWRCLWNILDDTVYPDSVAMSALLTLFLGAAVLLFLIAIQNALVLYNTTLDNKHFQRSVLDGVFYVVVNSSVVSMWRGLWNLVAEYVLPDLLRGGLTCHTLGTVGLMAVMCFRTVYDNSVDVDGEDEDGESFRPSITPVTGWTQLKKNNNPAKSRNCKQDDDLSSVKNQECNIEELISHSDDAEVA